MTAAWDNTREVVEGLLPHHPRVRLISNGVNRGKGYTVRAGMAQAGGEFLVFTDADLASPPSEIVKIVRALKAGADLAIATRVDSESRFIMSPAFFGYLYTRHWAAGPSTGWSGGSSACRFTTPRPG